MTGKIKLIANPLNASNESSNKENPLDNFKIVNFVESYLLYSHVLIEHLI